MTKRRKPLAAAAPWFRRPAPLAAVCAAVAAAGLYGGHAGLRRLRQAAAAWPENAVAWSATDFPAAPAWLQRDVAASAFAAAGPASRGDPDWLPRFAAALERTGWVVAPKLTWRDGKLMGRWNWRAPVAQVRWNATEAVHVAADGVLLRPDDLTSAERRRTPAIEAPGLAKGGAAPEVGQVFPDPRVLAAAAFAGVLAERDQDWLAGARIIPRFEGGALAAELRLAGGSVVHWGVVPQGRDLAERRDGLLLAMQNVDVPVEFTPAEGSRWQTSRGPAQPAVERKSRADGPGLSTN